MTIRNQRSEETEGTLCSMPYAFPNPHFKSQAPNYKQISNSNTQ